MDQTATIGVIHGRFQLLHLGHMEYLLRGMERCGHLVVGITNHDAEGNRCEDPVDPHRSHAEDNPFTYYERLCMIRDSLLEAGVDRSRFEIVPFPIEEPGKIGNYAPREGVYYLSIYDDWGRKKLEVLKGLGLLTEVLYERRPEEKLTSSSILRALIREGKPWEHLAPPAVVRYVREHGLEERVRNACRGSS